jgi:16S rRNA processing protein RimM
MSDAWDDMVLVGVVVKVHGLRGEVMVRPETDYADQRFAVGARVWVRLGDTAREVTIDRSRMHQGRPLVGFAGIDSVEGAEALARAELKIPESAVMPLEDGAFYWYQLVGAPVETSDGTPIGPVLRVEPTGGAGILVVAGASGEIQVPLVRDMCPVLTSTRIVVEAPEGLLELNAPAERRREGRHRHHLSRNGRRGARGRRPGPGGATGSD